MEKKVIVERPALPAFLNNREPETDKWHYGHALLIAGSYGRMGAAVLAARACLRTGAGLLTVHVPRRGVEVMQTALPEAMVSVDEDEAHWTHRFTSEELERYDAVGVGPGLGTEAESIEAMEALLAAVRTGKRLLPVVADADGLNMMARLRQAGRPWDSLLWHGMVVTPHGREYQRLFGDTAPQTVSRSTGAVVVCKGYRSQIVGSDGIVYENTTGNAAMATAGSGDVLTGIVLGIITQNKEGQLTTEECAVLAVWLHGKLGDLAVQRQPQCSVLAGDLINYLTYYMFD